MHHIPVLLEATRRTLADVLGATGAWLLDGTLGAAGHSSVLLGDFPGLRVWGTDQDDQMLAVAQEALASFGDRAVTTRARISELGELFAAGDVPFEGAPAAMLFDVGVASPHLDQPERGFSFQADAPLDMRMDLRREVTAADIVNTWPADDLADLLFTEGDERRSRQVAAAIVEARRRSPIQRTGLLADLVEGVVGGGRIHGATRTFQALRREVNREDAELRAALELGERQLAPGGLLAVIGFHPGENRVVKRWAREAESRGAFERVHKKPIVADAAERRENPRARSAELRVLRRLDGGAASPSEGGVR
ncbi:MAG: 16S rRNA (cytosine(1402)-N(4))-methyltransferase RsmH [Planctomycetota bacterium]|nr:16S rRNA (cytosine(1402)-N(4))-methyltransferase RsmH [Planctomycetota bacterium]